MKKVYLFLILIQLITVLIVAQNQQFKGNTLVTRKILIENYGGARNGNCPAANDTATYIKNLYPNEVSVINVHAGFFATPTVSYLTDFRTITGNDWDNFFGISMAGNPNGMINRKDFSSNHIKPHYTWQTEVDSFIGEQAIAQISVIHSYNNVNRMLDVDIKTKFLSSSTSNYKLICVLTEDSIIAAQLDYRLPSGSQVNANYIHNHVLRESLFGGWGILLNTSSININDSITKSVSNFSVSSNYNPNNLNIVAFIYDTLSFEVMQVEQIGIQSSITGIKINSKDINSILSPNPSSSILSITSSIDYSNIKIINSIGQTIANFENKLTTISVSDLSNGIYFIQLLDKKGNVLKIEKFIKE